MSASKASERVLKMQRNLSLRLYKSIMRSHRALPSGMRDVGDVYVREEFKLHKTAKPEHLGPFFEQWINYLNTLRAMESPESIGVDLPKEQIDALSDDQQEKLINMFNETQRLFSGNFNAADVGVDGTVDVHQVQIIKDGPTEKL